MTSAARRRRARRASATPCGTTKREGLDPAAAGWFVEIVDGVVGMSRAVDDEAACRFAAAFYGALAAGRSVKNVFAQGVWAMRHGDAGDVRGAGPTEREAEAFVRVGRVSDDEGKPKLLVREGVDAAQMVFAPPLRR
jgi:hypothetical protein